MLGVLRSRAEGHILPIAALVLSASLAFVTGCGASDVLSDEGSGEDGNGTGPSGGGVEAPPAIAAPDEEKPETAPACADLDATTTLMRKASTWLESASDRSNPTLMR